MSRKLRSLLFYLGLVPLTVIFSFVGISILPLPRKLRYIAITKWSRITIWWLKATCSLDFKVEGLENLPPRPGVILCKHQSAWETIALQLIFPMQSQVVKKELLLVPFFGWGLACLNPIAINRKTGLKALKTVLLAGSARINSGWWVLIFPEGTRVKPGHKGRYTQTGTALALKNTCPLVPVAHNAGFFWGKNQFTKKPGTIKVVVGKPLNLNGKSTKELTQEAEKWIEETCKSITLEITQIHSR